MKDGGSAFPRATEQTVQGFNGSMGGERGMTLRDYFAAKAMASIFPIFVNPCPEIEKALKEKGINLSTETESLVAMMSYEMADAMIIESQRAHLPDLKNTNLRKFVEKLENKAL